MQRNEEIDLEKISRDGDYCLQVFGDLEGDDANIGIILNQLEKKCSQEVALKLLNKKILFKLDSDEYSHSDQIEQRLLNIITKQDIPYNSLIPILIVQSRINKNFICHLIEKLLIEKSNFREEFINDDQFRPLFSKKVIDTLSDDMKNKNMNIDWEKIKSTPIKDSVINDEIKRINNFNGELSQEEKSIVSAAKALTNKDLVFEQLDKLNKTLTDLKKEKMESGEFVGFDEKSPKSYKHQKIFSGFLYKWAKDNDFGGYARIFKPLKPEKMLSNFSEGLLFKDIGTRGPYHGEWTHFLQWYILTAANVLSVKPNELLIWIGNQKNAERIWDNTFEGVGVPTYSSSIYRPEFDMRNVQSLNAFLLSDECKNRFPVLHEFVYSRSLKDRKVMESLPDQEVTRFQNKQ